MRVPVLGDRVLPPKAVVASVRGCDCPGERARSASLSLGGIPEGSVKDCFGNSSPGQLHPWDHQSLGLS